MEHQATCRLKWGSETASCKVLLEARQIIVRGEIRHRLPIAVLRDVSAHDGLLTFRVGQESVVLNLGSELAGEWAEAMGKQVPSPASKPWVETRSLQDLAGIGPSLEADLKALGVATVPQLAECDGLELYQRLCERTGTRQDPCVLDAFRCAVAQARDRDLPAEKRNWWWWSRARKAGSL